MRTLVVAALVAAVGAAAAPAHAALQQPAVISATPSSQTPHAIDDEVVSNAAVQTFTQVGSVMCAGGHFARIQDPARKLTLPRSNLFSFDVSTGQPTAWAPQVNGHGYVPRAGGVGQDICDAAARFQTAVANPTRPTWINYTGGDTLHSVAVTGAAVYVGGHQRWLDNPFGRDSAGAGAVSRPGIGTIDPTSGRALAWNPTKTRGVGTKSIYPTSTGIWFRSDGRRFAGTVHDSLAFPPFPDRDHHQRSLVPT